MEEKWQVKYKNKQMIPKVEDFTNRAAAMARTEELEKELVPSVRVGRDRISGDAIITVRCPRYIDGKVMFASIEDKIKSMGSLIEPENMTYADAPEQAPIELKPNQRINRHGIITDERSD